jgi:hypothetical protein
MYDCRLNTSMSTLIYNGIEIDLARITFNHENVYDEPSGLQYRHTKTTVNCQGYINASTNPAIGGESQASQVVKRIRGCLNKPRNYLAVYIGTDLYLSSPASGSSVDAANGPKPLHVEVTEIMGTALIMINFVIETCLYECCSETPGQAGSAPAQAWTTHTWSEDISIDEFFLTTRTRNGVLTVRADAGLSPDSFRTLVIPAIPNGFMRKSSKYLITEDQLSLRYSYTDTEVYKEPPPPAIKWEGERSAESDENGVKWTQQVRVKLWGAKTVSKGNLLSAAAIVIYNAINIGQPGINPLKTERLLQCTTRDSLTQNWVEISLRVRMLTLAQTFYATNNAGLYLVDLDHYAFENPQQTPPDPGTMATGLLAAVAPVLNDPCLGQAVLTTDLGQATLAGSYGPAALVATVPVIPNTQSAISTTESSLGISEHYELQTAYTTDYHTIPLPTVGSPFCSFAVLAPPTMTKAVSFSATRWDQPPTAPNPQTIDPNNVLLHTVYNPEAAQLGPDGQTPIYRLTGTYIYGIQDPTQVVLSAGALPYVASAFGNALYTIFSNGIIDAGARTATLVTGGFLGQPPVYNPFLPTTAALSSAPLSGPGG